jgi:hypothetical protein
MIGMIAAISKTMPCADPARLGAAIRSVICFAFPAFGLPWIFDVYRASIVAKRLSLVKLVVSLGLYKFSELRSAFASLSMLWQHRKKRLDVGIHDCSCGQGSAAFTLHWWSCMGARAEQPSKTAASLETVTRPGRLGLRLPSGSIRRHPFRVRSGGEVHILLMERSPVQAAAPLQRSRRETRLDGSAYSSAWKPIRSAAAPDIMKPMGRSVSS